MGIYGTKKYGRPAACSPISRLRRSSGSVSPDILTPRTKSSRIKSPSHRSTKSSVIKASFLKAHGYKFIGRKRLSMFANAVARFRNLYNLDGCRSNLEPVTSVEHLKDKSPRKRKKRNRQTQQNQRQKEQQQQQQQQQKRRHHQYRQLSQRERKQLLHLEQQQSLLQLEQEKEQTRQRQKTPPQPLLTCAKGEHQDLITPIVNAFKTLIINTSENLMAENTMAQPSTQDSNYMDDYSRDMAARTGAYPKQSSKNTMESKPMPCTSKKAENSNGSAETINATGYSDEMDDYSREIAAKTGAYPKRSKNKVVKSMEDNNTNDSSSKAPNNLNESHTDHTGSVLYSAMQEVLSNVHVWAPNPKASPNNQAIQESNHPWGILDALVSSPVEFIEIPDEPEEPSIVHPFVFCNRCEAIARFHCRTCKILMCSKCFCDHHPSHDSSHFQRPTGDMSKDFGKRQQQHDRCKHHGLVITHVCIECNVCTCDQCCLTKHAGHKRLPFARFVQKVDRNLRNTVSDGCASIAIIRQSIERAGKFTKNINEDYKVTHACLRRAVFQYYRNTGHHNSKVLMEAENTRFEYTQFIQRYMYAMQEALKHLVRDIAHIDRALALRHRPEMDDYELAAAALECRRRVDYFKQVMTVELQPMYMGLATTQFDIQTLGTLLVNSDPSISQLQRFSQRRPQQSEIPPCAVNAFVMNKTCHEDRDLIDSWSMPSQAIWNLPDLLSVRLQLQPSRTFALEGTGPGEVNRPWGVCVDSYGNIIVGDRRNNRIQKFTQNGRLILQFGCKGRHNGEFDLPAGVCVDISQNIYVVDKDNHRVQVFTHAGVFLFKFGSYGSKNGQFQYPWDVAVNTVGEVVVSDSRNHRIQLFTSSGRFMTKLCFKDLPFSYLPKNFTTPRGICFTPNGDVIVSDFEHHRLLLIDSRLQAVRAIRGLTEESFLNLSRPSGVCCDDDGRVIVADSKNSRMMVFSPDLDFIVCIPVLPTYSCMGAPDPAERDRPCDMAILPSGRLVVIVEASPETRALVRERKTFCKIY